MIHKVNIRGYNNVSPFKLFYLVDDLGLSDISESFKYLLLLPAVKEETTDLVKSWICSPYLRQIQKLKNTYISSYQTTQEEYAALLEDNNRKLEEFNQRLTDIEDELVTILASCKYLAVPIILHKKADYEVKYIVNSKCQLARDAKKIDTQIKKLREYAAYGSYYTNQINFLKSQNIRGAGWTVGSKLVINGEIKKHPCVMCPNALENLEGLCSFGGPLCAEKLTQIICPENKR